MPSDYDDLQIILQETLCSFKPQFTEGISEFEIITVLKKPPFSLFDENALRDPLMLFQTHFVLFHSLYRLRNQWRALKVGELTIGATHIKLHPLSSFEAGLQAPDPLADYYLDWKNLVSTDQVDVENLLNSFWQKMAGTDVNYHADKHILDEAAKTLQIISIEDLSVFQLKQQYRKLQHANHPDKGGSVKCSQRVLQAYTTLHKYLSSQYS